MSRSQQWAASLLLLVSVAIPGIAHATVIQRDLSILLDPAQVRSLDDGLGNIGNAWTSPLLPVAPFVVSAGDQVITRVRFSGNGFLQIRDTGNGFFQGGNEILNAVHFYEDGAAITDVRNQLTWFEPRGSFLSDTFTAFARTGAGGLGVGVQAEDFTERTFLIRGFDIVTDVLTYQLVRGAPVASIFEVEILAGSIRVLPHGVPEPATLLLVGLGLAGLGFARHRLH